MEQNIKPIPKSEFVKNLRLARRPSIASQLDFMSHKAYLIWLDLWMNPIHDMDSALNMLKSSRSSDAFYYRDNTVINVNAPYSSFIPDTHANLSKDTKGRTGVIANYPPFSIDNVSSRYHDRMTQATDEAALVLAARQHRSHVVLGLTALDDNTFDACSSVLRHVHNHVIVVVPSPND